jgi:adenine-specific DNA-methyltransferase
MKPEPFFAAPSPAAQKLEALRQLFPQAVEVDDKGRIRVNPAAIQLALDPGNPAGLRVEEDGYELRWVGKREAYHQAFVPTPKILSAAHDQSKDWDSTGNLLIKGDNLDALKLLRQSYFGKVKLIYIDPPYNTQSDEFIYRDNFSTNQTEVLAQLGYSPENIDYIKNIYGARTHSGWLSFMYPRLLLARDLLRDDGVIFISIDDNEQAQLKLLCDEVFGAANFVSLFLRQKKKKPSFLRPNVGSMYEYVVCVSKNEEFSNPFSVAVTTAGKKYPINNAGNSLATLLFPAGSVSFVERTADFAPQDMSDGNIKTQLLDRVLVADYKNRNEFRLEGEFRYSQATLNEIIKNNELITISKSPFRPNHVKVGGEMKKMHNHLTPDTYNTGTNEDATSELEALFGFPIFTNPKPSSLIQVLCQAVTFEDTDALVLDFFAGSGTTAEAVMRLNAEDGGNRQFILVQIPQPIDAVKQKEANHFVTHTLGRPEATIFEITAERIRRAGAKLQAELAAKRQAQGELLDGNTPPLDTGFRVFELVDDPLGLVHGRLLHAATQDHVQELQTLIATPQPADMQRVLSNLLLAEGLPLTTLIHTEVAEHLFVAADVALLLQALPLEQLRQALLALQAAGTPLRYLSVYAPRVQDDNLLLGLETLMDKLGLGKDKLRLRG